MKFQTIIPNTAFTADLDDLVIAGATDTVKVTITINDDSTNMEVYAETLTPDEKGVITIYDLPQLLLPYTRKMLKSTLTVSADGGAGKGTIETETTLYHSEVKTGMDAGTLLKTRYLTVLDGEKLTAPGRTELLSAWSWQEQVTVTAFYTDGTSANIDATTLDAENTLQQYDVSPSKFEQQGKTLTSYLVKTGSRTQLYLIDFNRKEAEVGFIFRNSFGCYETIYCTGQLTNAPEFKRSQAYMGGRLTTYDNEETHTMKADTGVLVGSMAEWALELMRSDDVSIITARKDGGYDMQPVVLTESKTEWTNEPDALPRFTFSYRTAGRCQNLLHLHSRLFDKTFDTTFN